MDNSIYDNPVVSIALCTYNGERYLQQQLDTLCHQTYRNIEIIIVDDGSTDTTFNLLKKYQAIDSRIKLYKNTQNLGYVKNFEKAINLCTGNYIALADQDDIWELSKIESMLNKIGDAILVYHDSAFINDLGMQLGKMSDILNMYSGSDVMPFLFYNSVSGHACMFSRMLLPLLGSFNPAFHHDWWIAYVAVNAGHINYINEPLVQYRQHSYTSTDILNRKKKPASKRIKYAEINLPWLQCCVNLQGKECNFIQDVINYYQNKGAGTTIKLLNLLVSHMSRLFFVKKKNVISKLNYIRKMVFYKRDIYYKVT